MSARLRLSAPLVFLLCLVPSLLAQNVWTWHNDNNRTGRQNAEGTLSPSTVSQTTFGLVGHYPVAGQVFAQPLAVSGLQGVTKCSGTCDVIFVADELDNIYAFNANPNASPQQLWSWNLATFVGAGDTALECDQNPPANVICEPGIIYPDIGVTSTPVIDVSTNTMYVVSLVVAGSSVNYYLHAISILTGMEVASGHNPIAISGSIAGYPTMTQCGLGTTFGSSP